MGERGGYRARRRRRRDREPLAAAARHHRRRPSRARAGEPRRLEARAHVADGAADTATGATRTCMCANGAIARVSRFAATRGRTPARNPSKRRRRLGTREQREMRSPFAVARAERARVLRRRRRWTRALRPRRRRRRRREASRATRRSARRRPPSRPPVPRRRRRSAASLVDARPGALAGDAHVAAPTSTEASRRNRPHRCRSKPRAKTRIEVVGDVFVSGDVDAVGRRLRRRRATSSRRCGHFRRLQLARRRAGVVSTRPFAPPAGVVGGEKRVDAHARARPARRPEGGRFSSSRVSIADDAATSRRATQSSTRRHRRATRREDSRQRRASHHPRRRPPRTEISTTRSARRPATRRYRRREGFGAGDGDDDARAAPPGDRRTPRRRPADARAKDYPSSRTRRPHVRVTPCE